MPLSMWQVLVLVAFFLYLLYYFACVVRKPRFICSSTNMRAFLSLNLAPLLEECFWPPVWCIAPNMQCLVSMALKVTVWDTQFGGVAVPKMLKRFLCCCFPSPALLPLVYRVSAVRAYTKCT